MQTTLARAERAPRAKGCKNPVGYDAMHTGADDANAAVWDKQRCRSTDLELAVVAVLPFDLVLFLDAHHLGAVARRGPSRLGGNICLSSPSEEARRPRHAVVPG